VSNEDLFILAEDIVDFLNGVEASCVKLRKQIEELIGPMESKPKALLTEETFTILKWQDEKGVRLGDYQVAYKTQNLPDKWQHCFNILKANNSVIANSFHMEGYVYRYWIYPIKYEDRIFRKKLIGSEAKRLNGSVHSS
jgi:hypothetical protein